jgi:hypothetical protein
LDLRNNRISLNDISTRNFVCEYLNKNSNFIINLNENDIGNCIEHDRVILDNTQNYVFRNKVENPFINDPTPGQSLLTTALPDSEEEDDSDFTDSESSNGSESNSGSDDSGFASEGSDVYKLLDDF